MSWDAVDYFVSFCVGEIEILWIALQYVCSQTRSLWSFSILYEYESSSHIFISFAREIQNQKLKITILLPQAHHCLCVEPAVSIRLAQIFKQRGTSNNLAHIMQPHLCIPVGTAVYLHLPLSTAHAISMSSKKLIIKAIFETINQNSAGAKIINYI